MSRALYSPWPPTSRRSWGWAAIAVVLITYFISAAPLIVVGVIAAAAAAGGAGAEQAEAAALRRVQTFQQAAAASLDIRVLLPALMVQFALWAGLVWLWAAVFERRGWASLGFASGFGGGLRYGLGLVAGLALFVVIILAALVLAGGEAAEPSHGLGEIGRLADLTVLATLALVVCVFLVQGGAEEIIFRGWLMSTLAARWGVRASVIVSSLFFMLFHAHVFISGWVFGLAALAGIGMLGLAFALLSLAARSVIEAVAAHGVFNAVAVVIPTIGLMTQDPDLSAADAIEQVFSIATGTAGAEAVSVGPQLLAQSLGGAIVCVLLLFLVMRRKPAPAWKAQNE